MKEMRAFPRLSLTCDIEYSVNSTGTLADNEKVISKTKDISQGGICLITNTPLNKGDLLNIKFRLKGYDKSIESMGKVVWTNVFEIGSQKGYDNGIEFIDIPEEFKCIIKEYIQKMFAV